MIDMPSGWPVVMVRDGLLRSPWPGKQ